MIRLRQPRSRPFGGAIACGLALAALIGGLPAMAAKSPADPPALYTREQAEQGRPLYLASCASCHGGNLQGGSAPANAGKVFLDKARTLGWTVDNLQSLVLSSMPLDNPGSLTPEQYADVLAFLLATDCYPAGKTPFPAKESPKLRKIKLVPPAGANPDDPDTGTCDLR